MARASIRRAHTRRVVLAPCAFSRAVMGSPLCGGIRCLEPCSTLTRHSDCLATATSPVTTAPPLKLCSTLVAGRLLCSSMEIFTPTTTTRGTRLCCMLVVVFGLGTSVFCPWLMVAPALFVLLSALIFQRNQSSVMDMTSFQALMRYNDYTVWHHCAYVAPLSLPFPC